jgi:hypothetical protein
MPEPGLQPVLVRLYPGRTQDEAARHYEADAPQLAALGYLPVSQSWADGQWPTALIVISVIFCIVLIGFVLLAVMIASKPTGTLAVTYVLNKEPT